MWLRTLILCLVTGAALADEIRLSNGDRITGEIKARTADRLVVQTEYAGEITIRLSEVLSLTMIDAHGESYEIGPLGLATFDPAAYRAEAKTSYSGRVLVSAAYARGNARSDQVHADGEFSARAKEYRYSVSGRIERRSEVLAADDRATNTAWLARADYDRFFDARRFAYVRGSLEHDSAKDIDHRAAAGAGYGLQLLEEPAANVSVRGGLDYVAVERIVAPREEYPAFGWGIKAAFSPWGLRMRLFHEQEGFWNLDDTEVVILRSKTGLRLPLSERLNATVQYNVDWERRPAPGRVSTDSTLLFGVDYAL